MKKMTCSSKPSKVKLFRDKWLKKGFELINVTAMLEPKLGDSGWCNDFNEPEESIYHVQLHYRKEVIANLDMNGVTIIDDDKYVSFCDDDCICREGDFIVFKLCPLIKKK
jgi:hypothetical protein